MLDGLYIGDANDITLTGLKNDASGSYVNNATVTAEVRTSGASPSSGSKIGSTVTLSYVGSSNGNYRGTFPSTDSDDLTEDTTYWVWITASGYTVRRLQLVAKYRGEA